MSDFFTLRKQLNVKPKTPKITGVQTKRFRNKLSIGWCVEEAASAAGLTNDQAIWICRKDPLMKRLVDQEASLDQLKKQAMAVLNDATNPQSSGAWLKKDVFSAAKLVIDTIVKVKPELLLKKPEKPQKMSDLANTILGADKAPGSEVEQ